jgi:hypothetical protein
MHYDLMAAKQNIGNEGQQKIMPQPKTNLTSSPLTEH